ncbi:polysaccharide deacetylase family protein [Kamptonema sp. UHCC 0994]|uniref:polysaccharide deacetylase family protein n=1 Tax=Kamptonema sp. UHCC 0994 TaxID=3031329 RepID=UPI0023B9AB15|nr:polysaccharide deacetylase family protein [Kamptonema sp. UHCC 0994]MDF0551654.1 polysaccharide deacetylase family protein [Kamptonema sp. UHCC 0994]
MADLNRLLRQRKTFTAAFVAAAGSFVLGVILPINLRLNQMVSLWALVQPQKSAASPEVLKVTAAVEERVEDAEKAIAILEEKQFSFFIPTQFQGTTVSKAKLGSEQKAIALTFDDGPWPETTLQILDILNKNDIKATFFWVGRYLNAFPELGKKVAGAGHAIGNHTWNHKYVKYSEDAAAKEIDRTSSLIEEVTGIDVTMFRPPGGILTNGLAAYAQKKKYTVVMWSVDSLDWRNSMQSLKDNVLRQASSGGIVLMHDGGGNRSKTVEALPNIIAELRKQGYKFVTVPELLQMQDEESKKQEIDHDIDK